MATCRLQHATVQLAYRVVSTPAGSADRPRLDDRRQAVGLPASSIDIAFHPAVFDDESGDDVPHLVCGMLHAPLQSERGID
jgi:hypothetical protein